MEENTDWGFRRKGAFQDNLLATERLLEAGIAPRWQLFLTKRCLGDLDGFLRLIYNLDLHKRCEAWGRKFEVFIGGISPEGGAYNLEDVRVDEDDAALIPRELSDICREGKGLLGQPEYILLETLLRDNAPPNAAANIPSLAINADYNVYLNIAEPAEWWRLGNLKTDGVDAIIRTYCDGTTPGMRVNQTMPIRELAGRYGDTKSKKLYTKNDLICRFLHQWGADHIKGAGY